jgi:hypothetical protein
MPRQNNTTTGRETIVRRTESEEGDAFLDPVQVWANQQLNANPRQDRAQTLADAAAVAVEPELPDGFIATNLTLDTTDIPGATMTTDPHATGQLPINTGTWEQIVRSGDTVRRFVVPDGHFTINPLDVGEEETEADRLFAEAVQAAGRQGIVTPAEEDTPPSPFTFFEERYQKKFFKEKPVYKEKIVLKEPDPITDEEEVIVNYNELADTLANEAVNKICLSPDITQEQKDEEYARQLSFYEELVIKHKRKTNA